MRRAVTLVALCLLAGGCGLFEVKSDEVRQEEPAPAPAAQPVLRFIWPVEGHVSSLFGARGRSVHQGIDIRAPAGSPVRAVEAGRVVYSGQMRGYGHLVRIEHGGGVVTVYGHNEANLVRVGDVVQRGAIVARVGVTGNAVAPHLHFEVWEQDQVVNPLSRLPQPGF